MLKNRTVASGTLSEFFLQDNEIGVRGTKSRVAERSQDESNPLCRGQCHKPVKMPMLEVISRRYVPEGHSTMTAKIGNAFANRLVADPSEETDPSAWFWIAVTAACIPWLVALVAFLI